MRVQFCALVLLCAAWVSTAAHVTERRGEHGLVTHRDNSQATAMTQSGRRGPIMNMLAGAGTYHLMGKASPGMSTFKKLLGAGVATYGVSKISVGVRPGWPISLLFRRC